MTSKHNFLSLFGKREGAPELKAELEQEIRDARTQAEDEIVGLRKQVEELMASAEQARARAAELRAKREAAQAEIFAIKEAAADTKAHRAIRQGVKASVDTVPMPVRLEVSQVKALKLLAAMDGTTASNIIRECIRQHLEQREAQNPAFAAALHSQS